MKETDILIDPQINSDDVINSFIPSNAISQLKDIEKMTDDLLKSLPKINRVAWRQEIENMIVPMQENPTTYDINQGLALCQGYRDRLSEMLLYAQREYKLRKRCLEMLFDAVNLISKASSADKRRGEATMKYPIIVLQVESAEIFMKEIESIYTNMKNTADSISRQASVINMQIQLGERRQGNPGGNNLVPQSSAEEITGKTGQQVQWDDF